MCSSTESHLKKPLNSAAHPGGGLAPPPNPPPSGASQHIFLLYRHATLLTHSGSETQRK